MSMKKKILCTVALALIVSSTAAFGAVKEGGFSVSPMIGGYVYDKNDQGLDTSLLVGIRAGYNITKAIGVEAFYDYMTPSDSTFWSLKNVALNRFGGQVLYHFVPDNVFVPYLAAGYSQMEFSGARVNNKSHGAFDYGAGVKYFLTDAIALRGDARHILYSYNSTTFNNLEFALGVYFQFGGISPVVKALTPVPAPVKTVVEPVVVTPQPEIAVSVPAFTPPPVAVVAVPVATLPPVIAVAVPVATPAPVTVVAVPAATLPPVKVVVVPVATPAPVTVVAVPVTLPAPVTVIATPAAVKAQTFCANPVVIAISFRPSKAAVKKRHHAELDKVGNFLKEFPHSKVTIEGYTDPDGNKNANLKLSQARADNLREYIIATYEMDGSRITATGYGSSRPVASNRTESGKKKNRRIEAVFICE